MNLIGDRIVDKTAFHSACDFDPKKDSGGWSKMMVVPNKKANEKRRKRITNIGLGIFISFEQFRILYSLKISIYKIFCKKTYRKKGCKKNLQITFLICEDRILSYVENRFLIQKTIKLLKFASLYFLFEISVSL